MSSRSRKAKKISSPHSPAPRATILGVSIFLMAITWLVFAETLRHPSINFDDQAYVFENPKINTGLTSTGVLWAFTHFMSGIGTRLLRSRTCWIASFLDCRLGGIISLMFYCTRSL
jgi:hypothetical protein